MKRQIKFRAKILNSDQRIYGYYYYNTPTHEHRIISPTQKSDEMLGWNIDPETIGQFTGLTDKNGTEIYEGDILKWTVRNRSKNRKGTHKPYKNPQERIGTVVWSLSGLRLKNVDYPDARWNYVLLNPTMDLEVIGNIHDNPIEE